MDAILDLEAWKLAWEEFVDHQNILPSVPHIIAGSWQRCWARLNPKQRIRLGPLQSNHLLSAQIVSFDLISVARPIMEDIYQYVENSDTAVVLVNGAGYVLDLLGDPAMLKMAKAEGIQLGAPVSEVQIGTNSFGLALAERVPVQVIGAQHYIRQLHELAGAAAPIFDPTGRPLGALGLVTPVGSQFACHPHTLGLVVAGARAIEGQRQSDRLLAEQNSQLAELNEVLAAISEGILVWNPDQVLMHANAAAAHILNLPARSLVGRPVSEVLAYPPFIQEALDKDEVLTDIEAALQVGARLINCVLSLRFVKQRNDLHWVILTFRQEKEIRQLVQRQIGSHAHFTLENIIWESAQMKRVYRQVKMAAAAQASILLRGESGTGKSILASGIHNESPRREGPFLIFACQSVPAELVLSELLGYEADFSINKSGGRPSKFELAQDGTMFFQDIEALPLEAQSILLNVIEIGVVQRLGSRRPIKVNVRFIASSSARLEKLVVQDRFRADLFYRLSVFTLHLPPLRERMRDLPVLADHILSRLSQQLKRPLKLAPGMLDLLKRYSWPGHVSELEVVLEGAAIRAGDATFLEPAHLPDF
ncbi:MAG TPA: sigma 54-interacting transcriptional regulator, partial [Anaerolineales bacterium]